MMNVAVSTSLFTDVEGSSALWEAEPVRMPLAMARHDALLRETVAAARGHVVKTMGDGVHAAFDDPLDAVQAALAMQLALREADATAGLALAIRCGMHVGAVERRDGDYFGGTVNRAARIMSAAHGGQVLLSQAVADLVRERLSPPATLRELGVLTLRGLAKPERIFQLAHPHLRQDFPALRALATPPTNLPQPVTSFVGREHELAEAKRLLAATRILTLQGAGGIGKTRLALKLGAGLVDAYADGVWFADLAPISDPQQVPETLAHIWGVQDDRRRSLADTLRAYVSERRLLLVLDNCEHLLDACRQISAALLQAGPGVQILATSREPLQIAGEQTYPIPALSLPDPASGASGLARSDAVRLFIARAQAQQPGFVLGESQTSAVAELCTRLDGIPLALELAAARLSVLSVDKIAARLNDRFRLLTGGNRTALPRQRTLRALIDWSYDLLSDAERRLFAFLAVFAGGFTLEAAEAVGEGDGLPRDDILDLLASLVQKSLVLAQPDDRYRMLETIREYALERLAASGASGTVRDRHHRFFLALVDSPAVNARDARAETQWLDRLEREHDNLEVALQWGIESDGLAESTVRLCGALFRFWEMRAYWREGRNWCAVALERHGAAASSDALATALLCEGQLQFRLGDAATARVRVERALAVAHGSANRRQQAAALNNLSDIVIAQGDAAAAQRLLEEAIAVNRELGNTAWELINLDNLGSLLIGQGSFAEAAHANERVLALSRELDDPFAEAIACGNLGLLARKRNDLAEARAMAARALAICRELRAPAVEVDQLLLGADTATAAGDFAAAKRAIREALAASGELDYRQGIARSLSSLAALAAATGAFSQAARWSASAAAERTAIGMRASVYEIAQDQALDARCRTALEDTEWNAARVAGAAAPLRATIADALAWLAVDGEAELHC